MGHLTRSLHSRAARVQRGATPPQTKKRDWSYSQWQRSLDPEAQQCIHKKKSLGKREKKEKIEKDSYPAEVKGVFSGSPECLRRCSARQHLDTCGQLDDRFNSGGDRQAAVFLRPTVWIKN